MAKYALVNDSGIVENVILWDGVTPLDLAGYDVIGVDDDFYVGPGFLYDGKDFSPPPQPDITYEECVQRAQAELAQRQRVAADRISVLQDAVDLDMATDQEIANLKAWKVYRVLLSRVNTSTAPDIEWPVSPE